MIERFKGGPVEPVAALKKDAGTLTPKEKRKALRTAPSALYKNLLQARPTTEGKP